jgi:predicted RecB family nuclease
MTFDPKDEEFGNKRVIEGLLCIKDGEGWRPMDQRELTRFAFDVKVRRDFYKSLFRKVLKKMAKKS